MRETAHSLVPASIHQLLFILELIWKLYYLLNISIIWVLETFQTHWPYWPKNPDKKNYSRALYHNSTSSWLLFRITWSQQKKQLKNFLLDAHLIKQKIFFSKPQTLLTTQWEMILYLVISYVKHNMPQSVLSPQYLVYHIW